jgi:hypothetical protein
MGELELGRYTGQLILEPLRSGQQMKTVLDFGFLDGDGRHWPVPPGTLVDQASIPKPLWSLLGDPWEGRYRDASVMHGYYCAVRSMDWQSVHRMFYHAMLVSGVSPHHAKLVYAGVYFAGPRWQGMTVESARLGQPSAPAQTSPANILYALCRDPITLGVSEAIECDGRSAFDWITSVHHHPGDRASEIALGLDKLADMVEEDDPSLRDLEAAIDYAVNLIPCVEGSPREISVGQLTRLD